MSVIAKQAGAVVGPGDNVLVMCPSFMGEESRTCLELLTPAAPENVYALSVLFTRSPSDHLDAWERCVGAYPARSRIVSVDADATSTVARPTERPEADDERAVQRVTSPQNLTQLGVKITDYLDEWTETAPDKQVAVCFRSLSTLLQYVDVGQAFNFLNVVTERCVATNAVAHYHLDPQAHDEQTIVKLEQLFDAVFAYDDGEWSVRRTDGQ